MGKYLIFIPHKGDDEVVDWLYFNSVDANFADEAEYVIALSWPELGEYKLFVNVRGSFNTKDV